MPIITNGFEKLPWPGDTTNLIVVRPSSPGPCQASSQAYLLQTGAKSHGVMHKKRLQNGLGTAASDDLRCTMNQISSYILTTNQDFGIWHIHRLLKGFISIAAWTVDLDRRSLATCTVWKNLQTSIWQTGAAKHSSNSEHTLCKKSYRHSDGKRRCHKMLPCHHFVQ